MKKAAKVFIWVGMILSFYLIYPIIVGAIALKKIDTARSRDELVGMGIITILFCSTLGGVFMLLLNDEQLAENNVIYATNSSSKAIVVDRVNYNPIGNQIGIIVCMASTLLGILSSLLLSVWVFGLFSEDELSFVLMTIGQFFVFVSLLVIFIINKRRLNIAGIIVTLVLATVCVPKVVWLLDYIWLDSIESLLLFAELAIFVLCLFICLLAIPGVKDTINEKAELKAEKAKVKIQVRQDSVYKSIEENLSKIKQLYDNNIITEEEYKEMRSSVLKKYHL